MKKLYILTLLVLFCSVSIVPNANAQGKKLTFRFSILKSNGDPQPGVILRVSGESDEYTADEQGNISFDYEWEADKYTRVYLYFPEEKNRSVKSFTLEETETDRIIYLDRQEDIIAFKQQNTTIPIKGIVKDNNGKVIEGATISIQGTGRKTSSNSKGEFQIDADYVHYITVRADGMENQSLNINMFLENRDEPLEIIMSSKNTYQIYSVVEHMPEFPHNGMKGFMNYLKRNLKYPEWAKKAGKEGVVVIQFIVERDGSISSPSIVRHLEASMDTAALEAIQNMPDWIPAKDHGKIVRCKYSVPVQFKIEKPKPAAPVPSKDSLATAIKPMPADSIKADSLATDTLGKTLLHVLPNDSLPQKQGLPLDSLTSPADSLLNIGSDTLRQDSTNIDLIHNDADTPKPRKRNIFVRFFRWLFGIKD